MKMVVNYGYGGWDIPEGVLNELGYKSIYGNGTKKNLRGDLRLIKMIENQPERFPTYRSRLVVIEIPDEATDYDILEYDGNESVIYVLNGKIHHV